MAQAQLVRQQQQQGIRQEQSLELVQTLLGASIGSLAFIRGLFPEECFTKMRYLPEFAENYRAFSTGDPSGSGRREQGVRITRLQRGVSVVADQVLEYLEKGVFQALKDGYLKALQIGIYTDKDHPDVVVESYTFSFSYRDEGGVALHVTNMSGQHITMSDASKRVQQVARNLLTVTEALGALPDQRWLSIRLHYLDHTPPDYEAPGFRRLLSDAPGLGIPGNVVRLSCGVMDAGYHSVSLRVSSVNQDQPKERPGRRASSRFFHANDDIETQISFQAPLDIQDVFGAGTGANVSDSTTLEVVMETPPDEQPRDVLEKGLINSMLQPSKFTDAPPTQQLDSQLTVSGDSGAPSRKRPAIEDPGDSSNKFVKDDTFIAENQRFVLREAKFAEIKKQMKLKQRGKASGKKKDIVDCECGCKEQFGGMICCDACNKWQHSQCYGFTSEQDPRVPENHFCYKCLLGGKEQALMAKLQELAFFRRTLWYIWENEKFPTTLDVLQAELECNREEAIAVLKRLVEEGFAISKTKKQQIKGSIHNLQPYKVVKNNHTGELLRAGYFNPRRYIEHHFEPPGNKSSVAGSDADGVGGSKEKPKGYTSEQLGALYVGV